MRQLLSLEHVLDAALDNDAFVDLMRSFAGTIGAKGFSAGWASGPAVENMFAFENDWSPEMVARYYADHAEHDPWTRASLCDGLFDTFVKMSDLVSARQYENSGIWNELLRPGGDDSFYALGMKTRLKGALGGLTFYRSPKADFDDRSVSPIAASQAILSKLLQIKATIAHGAAQARTWRMLADRFAGEVFVLDITGRLLDCNAIAEQRLIASDGLTLRAGRLVPTHRRCLDALDTAISEAVTCLGVVHLSVSDKNDLPVGYQIIRTSAPGEAARLMMLGDLPQYVSATMTDRLRAIYNLTPAEADVIVALANGVTVHDVAAKRGSSYETVRSQYRTALSKLDCKRIADAAILLRRVMPIAAQ